MTPAYASPEQVEGGAITTATDVYQLGMLLYLLLTGSWPYPRGTGSDAAMMLAICREPPVRPSTAAAGRGGVDDRCRAARRDRGRRPRRGARPPTRPASARELAGDLDTIVLTALRKEPGAPLPGGGAAGRATSSASSTGGRSRPGPTPSAYRLKTFVRRHTAATATAAASLALVVGLVAFYTIQLGARAGPRPARGDGRPARWPSFLTGLFEVSAPTRSKGEAVTARELLDRGAERIDDELADQPELQAAMMTVIGDVYGELAMFDEADATARRGRSRFERHPGDDRLDLAASLFALGEVSSAPATSMRADAASPRRSRCARQALGRGHPGRGTSTRRARGDPALRRRPGRGAGAA